MGWSKTCTRCGLPRTASDPGDDLCSKCDAVTMYRLRAATFGTRCGDCGVETREGIGLCPPCSLVHERRRIATKEAFKNGTMPGRK